MEDTETLLAIAQIALGLAGFGGVFLENAAGAFPSRAAGVFLAGLVFLVACGSHLFARTRFLWRS